MMILIRRFDLKRKAIVPMLLIGIASLTLGLLCALTLAQPPAHAQALGLQRGITDMPQTTYTSTSYNYWYPYNWYYPYSYSYYPYNWYYYPYRYNYYPYTYNYYYPYRYYSYYWYW
jgi:hypothetical protein